jgi:hypothetical protein
VTGREYFVSDLAGFGADQRDRIFRGDASLALRVFGQHAVTVQYVLEQRDARQPVAVRFRQSRRTLGVLYTFLGPAGFGAIQ